MRDRFSAILKVFSLAVLTAALLCLGTAALAFDTNSLFVSIGSSDMWGNTQVTQAYPVNANGYEDALWVQVPQGTDFNTLQLEIRDQSGEFVDFNPGNQTTVGGVTDAGDRLEGANPLYIYAFRADGSSEVIRLYVSSVTAQPALPSYVVWPQSVVIHYLSQDGYSVAEDSRQDVYQGSNTVYAQPFGLPEGYMLQGEGTQQVYAGEDGFLQPQEVTFVYTYQPPVSWPKQVAVHYISSNNEMIAPDTVQEIYGEGNTPVYASPATLPAEYVLRGEGVEYVYADAQGNLSAGDVTFVYDYVPQVSWPKQVVVHYISSNNEMIAPDTVQEIYGEGNTPVYASPATLPAEYVLRGEGVEYVYADAQGNLSAGDVTFVYDYVPQVSWPRQVIIHYIDETGATLCPDTVGLVYGEGETLIQASPEYLPEDHVLRSDGVETVIADSMGNLSREEITFIYDYVPRVSWPKQVTVRFVSQTGESVATDVIVNVDPGENVILPEPYDLRTNYVLQDEYASAVIYAQEDGTLSQTEVTFIYDYNAPVVWPQYITVYYRDENGYDIAAPGAVAVNEGMNTILPQPEGLSENYVLQDANAAFNIMADSFGNLSQTDVTFTYVYNAPVTWPVTITVHYQTREGLSVATDTFAEINAGQNTVLPTPQDLSMDYVPETENAVVIITAAQDGSLSQTEAVFYYAYQERVTWPVNIPVHYLLDDGETVLYPDTLAPVLEGENVITPACDTLSGYEPAGAGEYIVYASADGTVQPGEITFIYRKTAQAPQVTWPVYIPVRYMMEESDESIAPDGIQAINAGENRVYPDVTVLPAGFVCQDEYVLVYADENGVLSQQEVVFVCYEEQADDPGQNNNYTAQVTVCYLGNDNTQAASNQYITCYEGENVIRCEPDDLQPGYELISASFDTVNVGAFGADKETVVFWYNHVYQAQTPVPQPTLTPAPAEKSISVVYINRDNMTEFYRDTVLCTRGAATPVYANLQQVNDLLGNGYETVSENPVTVSVYDNGTANVDQVVFYFSKRAEVIWVYYKNGENQDIATATPVNCYEGQNEIMAAPADLQPGYELDLSRCTASQQVYLSGGQLTPSYVTFYYKQSAVPTPAVQEEYRIQPMDRYARTMSDTATLRSAPTTREQNQLGTVNRTEIAHVIGEVINRDNETWYLVDVSSAQGFLKGNVIKFLTEEEVQAYFATPTPVITATPKPENGGVNLWAKTTSSQLNVRSGPGTDTEKVLKLENKNTQVWVLEEVTNTAGEQWYHVLVKNKEGYIMSKYLKLMSESESEKIQDKLKTPAPTLAVATPVPTIVPTFTPVPTAYVSPVPATQEPVWTATPQPTATPAPYRGYALTYADNTCLRSAADLADWSINELLPIESLVLIDAQMWVNGELWDHVFPQDRDTSGYIPDAQLEHIDASLAEYYLERLQPVITPPPATPTPAPYGGYCITLGDRVPLRDYPDSQGFIQLLLENNSVCWIDNQVYAGDTIWESVQYAGMRGYIRADQVRRMSDEEVRQYLNASRTPTPAPAPATPEPVTEESYSCYGYVSTDRLNLRAEPGTAKQSLMVLKRYTAMMINGTELVDNELWYNVMLVDNETTREGYVAAKYVTQLKINEVEAFFNSEDYRNTLEDNEEYSRPENLQSYEDYNYTNWNTAGTQAPYQPFNPYTPVPSFDFGDDQEQYRATPTPTPGYGGYVPSNVTGTPYPYVTVTPQANTFPINSTSSQNDTAQNEEAGSSLWIIAGIALLVIAAAGAVYAYSIHTRNERRRSAVRRQAAGMAAQNNAVRPPQTRPAPQSAQNVTYMPPRGGAPRPAADAPMQPVNQNAFRPVAPVGTPVATKPVPPLQTSTQNTAAEAFRMKPSVVSAEFTDLPKNESARPMVQPVATKPQAAPVSPVQANPVPPVQAAPASPVQAGATQRIPIIRLQKNDAQPETAPLISLRRSTPDQGDLQPGGDTVRIPVLPREGSAPQQANTPAAPVNNAPQPESGPTAQVRHRRSERNNHGSDPA